MGPLLDPKHTSYEVGQTWRETNPPSFPPRQISPRARLTGQLFTQARSWWSRKIRVKATDLQNVRECIRTLGTVESGYSDTL